MTFVLLSIGYGLILMTALSCIRGPQWWIRFADFPRIQIAVCLVLVGAVFLFVAEWARFGDWAFGLLLLASLIYQGSRIFPYTRFATRQVLDAATVPADSTIRILICNVQMENRKAQDIISLVHQYEPDLFLVLEGDDWWDQELRVLDAIYPLTIRQPQDNRYGIHFFSRLDVVNSELRFLVDPEIPSIEAKVRLRSGVTVDFHGIHPRPPLPKQGTERRDAELLILAREMLDDNRPTIVAGDLNDVAWSHTTRLFQRISGLLDPRRGAGPVQYISCGLFSTALAAGSYLS